MRPSSHTARARCLWGRAFVGRQAQQRPQGVLALGAQFLPREEAGFPVGEI